MSLASIIVILCIYLYALCSAQQAIQAYTITCNEKNQCQNQEVECEREPCDVICSTALACSGTTIYCPRGTCTIQCAFQQACERITIHAEKSKALNIKIATARNTMSQSHIYVPNTGQHETTVIDCKEGSTTACHQMNIYSTYGFADVQILCKSKDCVSESILHCLDNYQISCQTSCANGKCLCPEKTHKCNTINTPIPTKTPTNPSVFPTKYPTDAPTIYPSIAPTTNEPTLSPVREGEVNPDATSVGAGAKNRNGLNGAQSSIFSGTTGILYGVVIIIGVILCCVIVGVLFRCYVMNRKVEVDALPMKDMKENNIIKVSSCSNIDEIHTVSMTPATPVMPMTPMKTLTDTEGEHGFVKNDDNDEDMYNSMEQDGNGQVTTGYDVVTPRGDDHQEKDKILFDEAKTENGDGVNEDEVNETDLLDEDCM